MDILQAIESRQSIREYEDYPVDRAFIDTFLTTASRAPSSWNLQPWRFVVIQQPSTREMLKPHVYFNVPQLMTSSFLVLILNDLERYQTFDTLIDLELAHGYVTADQADAKKAKAKEAAASRPRAALEKEGLLDCGMVSQTMMLLAKHYGLDSCPMGGFDRPAFMEKLNLDVNRYQPGVLLSFGKAKSFPKASLRLPLSSTAHYF